MPGERIFYLDALRSFCMLVGIIVHGVNIWNSSPTPGPYLIGDVSGAFRMATFFLIAGFFTAMAVSRMTPSTFLRSRVEVILVPLMTSLIFLAPLTNWLVHRFHNPEGRMGLSTYLFQGGWRQPTAGEEVWHLHFWFLFSLMLFALLTPVAVRLIRSQPVTRVVDGFLDVTGRFSLWALVLVLGLVAIALTGFQKVAVEPLMLAYAPHFAWIARASFFYLPLFLLGVLAFLHPRFFESLHRLSIPGLLLFVGLAVLAGAPLKDLPFPAWGALNAFARAGLMVFAIAGLLALFRRFLSDAVPLLVMVLTSAAYTFYLVHYTVIYLIANLMQPLTGNLWLIYAVILVAGTPLCILFHTRLVAPSPLLRFMLNGRRPVPRPTPAAS